MVLFFVYCLILIGVIYFVINCMFRPHFFNDRFTATLVLGIVVFALFFIIPNAIFQEQINESAVIEVTPLEIKTVQFGGKEYSITLADSFSEKGQEVILLSHKFDYITNETSKVYQIRTTWGFRYGFLTIPNHYITDQEYQTSK